LADGRGGHTYEHREHVFIDIQEPAMKNVPSLRLIVGILIAVLLLPVLAGAIYSAATPSVSPEEAALRLRDPEEKAVLIDVRNRKEYDTFSLKVARNLPPERISDKASAAEALGDAKTVILICDTGFDGAGAVRALRRLGYRNVLNVAGGMDAWLGSAEELDKTVRTNRGETSGVTTVSWSLFEQIMIVLTAFVLKPVYQIISIIIMVLLWKRSDRDLTAVKWAMLSFVIGENACAANYLFFNEQSLLMEFFHMYGMLLCFGFVVYALMEAVDKRVLHFSDRERPCALLPQCGRCYKHQDVSCTLRSFFLLLIPAAVIVAAIPLSGPLAYRFHGGTVFGTLSVFGQPVAYQYLEARIFPVFSLFFFGAALSALVRLKEGGFGASKVWFAMGMGLLGFSLLRFFFYWGYQGRPLWADVWEEITEFLFIVLLLWIALRVRKTSRISQQGSA
jgi:rhodanese-related sulfurtransferase